MTRDGDDMRILIVEDERAIAEVEKAYIERDGYSAEIAADGLEGIGKFREKQFDLVILDLMLPACRESTSAARYGGARAPR